MSADDLKALEKALQRLPPNHFEAHALKDPRVRKLLVEIGKTSVKMAPAVAMPLLAALRLFGTSMVVEPLDSYLRSPKVAARNAHALSEGASELKGQLSELSQVLRELRSQHAIEAEAPSLPHEPGPEMGSGPIIEGVVLPRGDTGHFDP